MKERMQTNILGLLDTKNSILELEIDTVYIGNKRFLNFNVEANIIPNRHKEPISLIEKFALRMYIDETLLEQKEYEVDLLDGGSFNLDTDLELTNTQYETRLIKLELVDLSGNNINYTAIRESINIEPIKESKTYIILNHSIDNDNHNFSFRTNSPVNRIFMKINNNSWKEVFKDFSIKNDDLEGKVNYIQLYTTDKENTKIYSNMIKFNKIESPE